MSTPGSSTPERAECRACPGWSESHRTRPASHGLCRGVAMQENNQSCFSRSHGKMEIRMYRAKVEPSAHGGPNGHVGITMQWPKLPIDQVSYNDINRCGGAGERNQGDTPLAPPVTPRTMNQNSVHSTILDPFDGYCFEHVSQTLSQVDVTLVSPFCYNTFVSHSMHYSNRFSFFRLALHNLRLLSPKGNGAS